MNNFVKYLLPGILFIIYGTWWIVHIASWECVRRRLLRRKEFDDQDKSLRNIVRSGRLSRCSLPLPCHSLQSVSVEGVVKLLVAIAGIVVALVTADGALSLTEVQYATIYVFFGLSGFGDIISVYPKCPPKIDYFLLSLAFGVQAGIIWSTETKFKDVTDSELQIKNILVILAILCCICTVTEGGRKSNISWRILRSYLIILQGSWFIVSFVTLECPYFSWFTHQTDSEDDDRKLWFAILLSWACGAVFFYVLFVYVICFSFATFCRCCRVAENSGNNLKPNSNMFRSSTADESDIEELINNNL